jgi:hypothetical protein
MRVTVLAFGTLLILIAACIVGLWVDTFRRLAREDIEPVVIQPLPPRFAETVEPMLLVDGDHVICDPFAEIRTDRMATKAKYDGKTVLLHGIAQGRLGVDGSFFLRCSGPRGTTFYLEVSKDRNFDRVRVEEADRVVAKAELHQFWSGCLGYFDNLTVWTATLQEIQTPTEAGWQVIWALEE